MKGKAIVKALKNIILRPIGIIHSEHKEAEKTPIQPVFARGCRGVAIVYPEYAEGLKDIDGFSHLYLLYYFHKAGPASLMVKPFLDDEERGVFACRHPCRPNHIGMSLVKMVKREGNKLILEDVDILDGTPLLDIKPFKPQFDIVKKARSGWMGKIDLKAAEKRGQRGYSKK